MSGLLYALLLPFLMLTLPSQDEPYLERELKMNAPLTSVAVSPDGSLVLFGMNEGSFGMISDSTGAIVFLNKEAFTKAVNALSFSPRMDFILAAGANQIKLYRPDGNQVAQWKPHATTIWTASLSPDGKYAVSAEFNKTFRLWDVYSGEVIENMRGHDDVTLAVTFSPDTRLIASGSVDKTIRIWDRDSLKVMRVFNGHALEIYDLKFSPDGRTLASASKDKTIRLWDVETGNLLHILKGHTDYVMEVAFTPDGRYLLSASADQTVRLWDVAQGEEIYSYIGHDAAVMDLSVLPDGKAFYTASMDACLRKWDIDPEIFVLRYFGEEYSATLAENHLFDERRKGESKGDYESRMESAARKKAGIVSEFYARYLERFSPVPAQ
ncbi:MAG: WD40 repeat domain-containing protein [Bacteroidota bacterium]